MKVNENQPQQSSIKYVKNVTSFAYERSDIKYWFTIFLWNTKIYSSDEDKCSTSAVPFGTEPLLYLSNNSKAIIAN